MVSVLDWDTEGKNDNLTCCVTRVVPVLWLPGLQNTGHTYAMAYAQCDSPEGSTDDEL